MSVLIPDDLETEFVQSTYSLLCDYSHNPAGSDYSCKFCGAHADTAGGINHDSNCIGIKLLALAHMK